MNRYLMQRIIQYVPALIEFDNLFGFSKESMTTHQHQKEKRVIISSKQSITPIHVILADDDEDDRDLFTEAMREINIKVQLETLKDGNSLLDRLLAAGKKLPDLLFLDLNMPDKNGRECLDIIRNTERLKDINVIIYSTSSSSKDINDTYDKGANLYIAKPASFTDILAMAKRVLTLGWEGYKPFGNKQNFVFSCKTN